MAGSSVFSSADIVQISSDGRQQDWLPLGPISLLLPTEPIAFGLSFFTLAKSANRSASNRQTSSTQISPPYYLPLHVENGTEEINFPNIKAFYFLGGTEKFFINKVNRAVLAARGRGFVFGAVLFPQALEARLSRLSAKNTDSLSHPMQFGRPEVETYPRFPGRQLFVKSKHSLMEEAMNVVVDHDGGVQPNEFRSSDFGGANPTLKVITDDK